MSGFIQNVKQYLSEKKIKQSYLSLMTGIEKNKLSRILSETQEVTESEMETIAKGLGRKPIFFLEKAFVLEKAEEVAQGKIAFYAGEPTKAQEKTAKCLIQWLENIDEIMSADLRFQMIAGE